MNYHRSNIDVIDSVEDGWGSDLEIDDADDDDPNRNASVHHVHEYDYQAITPVTTNRKIVAVDIDAVEVAATTKVDVLVSNDGWGHDDIDLDDDDDDDDAIAEDRVHQIPHRTVKDHPSHFSQPRDGNKSHNHSYTYTQLEYELHEYILSIPQRRVQHLTKILQQQYNTTEKAVELYQYYMKRPQLLQYTIEKELSRLDYTIVTTPAASKGIHGASQNEAIVIQDKDEIRQILSSQLQVDNIDNDEKNHTDDSVVSSLSICGRCANQSILVDAIQAMSQLQSNDDTMILLPSQYMCSAVASQCHFKIDLIESSVMVTSYFHISLPLLNGRWNIGQIQIRICFHCPIDTSHSQPVPPLSPRVQFHVQEYKSLIMNVADNLNDNVDEAYCKNLQQCATIIQELSMMMSSDDPPQRQPHIHSVAAVEKGTVNFRDAYVNELLTTTDVVVDGMKSAWQDFETATGLVSKFKKLPSLFPSVVDPYGDEYDESAAQTKHSTFETSNASSFRASQQPHHQNDSYNKANNESVVLMTHQEQKPPPSTSRPTSLLGGFVRSLAQSVTLPQEDPSIYQEWQQQQNEPYPQLYQPTSVPSRTMPTAIVDSSFSIPRLYNIDAPSQSKHKMSSVSPPINYDVESIPRFYTSNEPRPYANLNGTDPKYSFDNSPNRSATTSEKLVTMERKVDTNMNDAVTLEIDSKHQPQEGWDDDIDLDDFDGSDNGLDLIKNDGVDEPTETAQEYDASSCPIRDGIAKNDRSPDDVIASAWAYDPVTDITPTRIRYKNPIGGSRDIRYI